MLTFLGSLESCLAVPPVFHHHIRAVVSDKLNISYTRYMYVYTVYVQFSALATPETNNQLTTTRKTSGKARYDIATAPDRAPD